MRDLEHGTYDIGVLSVSVKERGTSILFNGTLSIINQPASLNLMQDLNPGSGTLSPSPESRVSVCPDPRAARERRARAGRRAPRPSQPHREARAARAAPPGPSCDMYIGVPLEELFVLNFMLTRERL